MKFKLGFFTLIGATVFFPPQGIAQTVAGVRCDGLSEGRSHIQINIIYPETKRTDFTNQSLVQRFIESMRDEALKRCADVPPQGGPPPISRVSMTLSLTGDFAYQTGNVQNILLVARYDLTSRRWDWVRNFEAQRVASEKLKEEQNAQQTAARAAAVAALENAKQLALNDCQGGPKLSGGPWFSSTYRVAANDEIKNAGFFCVKSVEYISAAPNPFGGNAARARFTGYRVGDFQSLVTVRDFAY
jgi:hypothetical protein